jgi:hypothetical protein
MHKQAGKSVDRAVTGVPASRICPGTFSPATRGRKPHSASLGRKCHSRDNDYVGSLVGSPKAESVNFQTFRCPEEALACITDYICSHNCERLHSSPEYCTPFQFEARAAW